jgi:hypothetical protein
MHRLVLLFLAIVIPKTLVAEEVTCGNCPHIPADHWHLLTRSFGGTVSLIKNLTKEECEFARNRSLRLPATEEEKKSVMDMRREWYNNHPEGSSYMGESHLVLNGDIATAECFE